MTALKYLYSPGVFLPLRLAAFATTSVKNIPGAAWPPVRVFPTTILFPIAMCRSCKAHRLERGPVQGNTSRTWVENVLFLSHLASTMGCLPSAAKTWGRRSFPCPKQRLTSLSSQKAVRALHDTIIATNHRRLDPLRLTLDVLP